VREENSPVTIYEVFSPKSTIISSLSGKAWKYSEVYDFQRQAQIPKGGAMPIDIWGRCSSTGLGISTIST
jgi:hypothetical protein